MGRTSVLYACVLILGEDILTFRLMNDSVRFALCVMLSICLFHLRSEVIVRPKYFTSVVFSSVCPFSVYLFIVGFLLRVIGSI